MPMQSYIRTDIFNHQLYFFGYTASPREGHLFHVEKLVKDLAESNALERFDRSITHPARNG